jgi:hypothetical protein
MWKKQISALAIIAIFAVSSVSAQSTWASFWQNFKSAVVKNDKKTVLNLSKNSLSNSDFNQLFGSKSKRNCFAKAKPVKDSDGSYSVFCGEQGYYFQKVDGKFKFIEGFAND